MELSVELNLELSIEADKGAVEAHHLGVGGGEGAVNHEWCDVRNIFGNMEFSQAICSRTI